MIAHLVWLVLIDVLLVGLIAYCCVVVSTRFRSSNLLLLFGMLSFLSVFPFMFRKYWEEHLLFVKQALWYDLLVVQGDNSFWEQLAKIINIYFALYWAEARGILPRPAWNRTELALLGYWVGLCYGMGEAVLLALLMLYPSYAPIFNLSTLGVFLTGGFVYERFWTDQCHAIMGLILGLGVFYSRVRGFYVLTAFFLLAMAYHMSIDGQLSILKYYPHLAEHYPSSAAFFPLIVLLGYGYAFVIMQLAQRSLHLMRR